jgi:hypothetical protein
MKREIDWWAGSSGRSGKVSGSPLYPEVNKGKLNKQA